MLEIFQKNRSESIFQHLECFIPGGVNSAGRAFKAVNRQPLIIERAKGDTLFDVDGHSYIDYCGSWGALIHGHAQPEIIEALTERAKLGTSFGLSCPIEGELAETIVKHFPSMEQVRFVSSGTEATMSAARLARGFTGRHPVIKFDGNYHGHADSFLIQAGSGVFGLSPTSSSAGVPPEFVQHTLCLPYNDVKTTREFLRTHQVAGVIVEPIAGNMGVVPASHEFLHMLREETHKQGALLIFDEVITGFRVSLGGAQKLYGVVPDLTCLGKIIGGGLPAAAFGGRREIMQQLAPLGNVYQAGTLSGNPVAMAAGLASLRLLEKEGFYPELQRKTELLTLPIHKLLKQRKNNACLQQVGSMFTLFFGCQTVQNREQAAHLDKKLFETFFKFLLERGVFIPPSPYEAWFVSMAHTDEHLEETSQHILEFFQSFL